MQIGGNVYAERDVAVRPFGGFVPVDPDFGVGHGSVEIDIEALALVLGSNVEMFTIPSDTTPRQFGGEALQFGTERSLYAPVVGHIQLAPFAVIVVVTLHPLRFGQRSAVGLLSIAGEKPVCIKTKLCPGFRSEEQKRTKPYEYNQVMSHFYYSRVFLFHTFHVLASWFLRSKGPAEGLETLRRMPR